MWPDDPYLQIIGSGLSDGSRTEHAVAALAVVGCSSAALSRGDFERRLAAAIEHAASA